MIFIYNLEDYRIIRHGIRYLLSHEPGLRWLVDSSDPAHLFHTLQYHKVDVLILDIYLDAMQERKANNGYEICEMVVKKYPHTKVLAHSMYDDSDKVIKMLQAGASGLYPSGRVTSHL